MKKIQKVRYRQNVGTNTQFIRFCLVKIFQIAPIVFEIFVFITFGDDFTPTFSALGTVLMPIFSI